MKRFFLLAVPVLFVMGCVGGSDDVTTAEDLNDAYEELLQDDGSADSARCSGVVVPDRGPFDGKIALTFDDGPSLTYTPQVLEILAAHHAVATFFINGKNVTSEEHWELLREMVAAGHHIGNHTQNHPNSVTLSAERFRREVSETHEIVSALGQDEDEYYFRFPFGSSNCSTAETVRDFGYHIVGWHIDTADWCFASSTGGVGYCSPRTFRYVPDQYRDDYVGFTLYQLQSTNGGVLLMHDIHAFTVSQLDRLLTALEEAGYQFVGLDDVETFPLLNGQEPAATPWVGTPCTDDGDCRFTYGELTGYCDLFSDGEHGICSLPCEGYCPDRYGHATTFCVETVEGGAGQCVPKSEEANGYCADLPGTEALELDRWIGSSGAQPATAVVCVERQD